MPERTFISTVYPHNKSTVLRIPASGGGYKKIRLGVPTMLTEKEAAILDEMKGIIVKGRKPKTVRTNVVRPLKQDTVEKEEKAEKEEKYSEPSKKDKGGDGKKWQE